MTDQKILGIVPARGGSKRLPEKNILPLAGKPMIAWMLEAARAVSDIEKLVVSTDSPKIAQVAETFDVPVPWLRPAELATDEASTQAVVEHALAQEERTGSYYDAVVILQPTSPLCSADDIQGAIDLFWQKQAEGVASVTRAEHPREWMNVLPPDLSLKGFLSEDVLGKRSQDLPVSYRLNGAVSIISAESVRQRQDFWDLRRIFAYVMDPMHSVDIDTELDFLLAEALLKKWGQHG